MFWGFILEPKKRYNTTVSKGFHISMAALDPKSVNENDITSVVLTFDGTDTILCNLGKPNLLQERLDLNFVEGDTITLEAKGKACVHLSGYFIAYEDYPKDMSDLEDDSDLDEEEGEDEDEEDEENYDKNALKALKSKLKKQNSAKAKKASTSVEEDEDTDEDESDEDDESMDVSDLTFDDEEDSEEEDDDDEEEGEDEEEEEAVVKMGSPGSTPMPPKKKNKSSQNSTPVSTNKQQKQQHNDKSGGTPGSNKKNKGQNSPQQQQKALTNGTSTPMSNKKKKNKDGAGGTPNVNNSKQAQQQNEGNKGTPRKSLEGGVIVEDLKVGQGVPAKSGKMVSVYYVGKLKNNNKQFDSTTQGPGFKFRLGKGEVIKGWDVGLNGMKVGGKRRITIPSHMAYGNKGSPPAIPPNSTLVFDVELKNVN